MIRKFEKNDIDKIMKIWLNVNINTHHFIPSTYWKNNFNTVKKMLPQSTIYVYDNNKIIQGLIGLMDNYIAGLFICNNVQSKGIGKQLLNYVKQNKNNLLLQVYKKNKRAIKFYQREGFVIQSEKIDDNTKELEFVMSWKNNNINC